MGLLSRRRGLAASAALLVSLAAPGAHAAPAPAGAWELEAERLEKEPAGWRARGAVRLTGPDGTRLEAPEATFDPAGDRLEVAGPLSLESPQGLSATGSGLLGSPAAGTWRLEAPRGQLAGRYRFQGASLSAASGAFSLADGWWTGCRSPEPDLMLAARRLWVRPEPGAYTVAWEGAWLRVAGRDLLPLPPASVRLEPRERGAWPVDLYPVSGFDAYRGPYAGFEAGGPLGASAWRYRAPLTLSAWRGAMLGLGVDGPLGAGFRAEAGASLESAWAQARGGPRARVALARPSGAWGETELALAYRDEANFQALTRLPDLRHRAELRLGALTLRPELTAGRLLEEDSRAAAWRARLAPAFETASLGGFWGYGQPFLALYAPEGPTPGSAYGGGTAGVGWRGAPWPGASLELAAETTHAFGATPFFYERLVDAERLRGRLAQRFGPLELDGGYVHSRVLGQWGPEDLSLGVAWHWNCFAARLGVRPLRLGLEAHLLTVDF